MGGWILGSSDKVYEAHGSTGDIVGSHSMALLFVFDGYSSIMVQTIGEWLYVHMTELIERFMRQFLVHIVRPKNVMNLTF